MHGHSRAAESLNVRVAIAQGEPEQAERDAHDALARRRRKRGVSAHSRHPRVPRRVGLAEDGSHREAARLFGAAHAIWQRMGAVRFKVWDAGYEPGGGGRDALGDQDFDRMGRGAGLSTEEAIAYAQRGRGERKRPTSGWASLTPTDATCCDWSAKACQQRHRHPAFRLTAHRANPPDPRLHQTRPHLPRTTRPRSSPPHLNAAGETAGRPNRQFHYAGTRSEKMTERVGVSDRIEINLTGQTVRQLRAIRCCGYTFGYTRLSN